jgi:hypothetical protein
MKKDRNFWIVIVLLVSTVALGAFHCFTSGKGQVRWTGKQFLRIGKFEGADCIQGQVRLFTVYSCGPISFWARHD